MKDFAKIVIFILISTLTFSCYKPLEFTEFDSANLNFENNQGLVDLTITVNNPNFYKITIIETNLEIFMNDKFLGKINEKDQNIVIAANSSTNIKIPLNLDLGNIISNAGNFLKFFSKSNDTNVKVKGTVIGKTFFGKKRIQIDQEKNISK